MKQYKWLFMLFLGIPWTGYSQTHCINFCNDVYKDIIQYQAHYDPGIQQFDYATTDVDLEVGGMYKIKMTHIDGSYICQNPQMHIGQNTILSNDGFVYPMNAEFRFYFYVTGVAPGNYEVYNFEIYKRDSKVAPYIKKKSFKIYINVICAWEFTADPYTNTSVYGRKFEAGNYVRGNGPFTNSNIGFISFDAGNFVEWNSFGTTGGFVTNVSNGYIEAYIEGCGGKSGVVGELEAEIAELPPQVERKISLAPNPTNGYATVSFNDADSEKLVRLYDASGRLLQELTIQEQEFRLDISNELNGLYFIQVEENGQRTVLKIIKQ